jgi:hypothetical protein
MFPQDGAGIGDKRVQKIVTFDLVNAESSFYNNRISRIQKEVMK